MQRSEWITGETLSDFGVEVALQQALKAAAVTCHRPVREAMPLMVSPERTVTRVVLACVVCCVATVAEPRRWLTIAITLS